MSEPRKMIDIPGGFRLMPAKAGTCEVCATAHDPELPHNRESLFYQYRFWAEHQRWPNWADALEHCSIDTRAKWFEAMRIAGIDAATIEATKKDLAARPAK